MTTFMFQSNNRESVSFEKHRQTYTRAFVFMPKRLTKTPSEASNNVKLQCKVLLQQLKK